MHTRRVAGTIHLAKIQLNQHGAASLGELSKIMSRMSIECVRRSMIEREIVRECEKGKQIIDNLSLNIKLKISLKLIIVNNDKASASSFLMRNATTRSVLLSDSLHSLLV